MEGIENLTTSDWIAIAAIIVPLIFGALVVILKWLWKVISHRKIEVVTPSLGDQFSKLNKQIKAKSFLNSNGKLSEESILENHRVLFQGEKNAGKFREKNVYISCCRINDDLEGTVLVEQPHGIFVENKTTNLMSHEKIRLTLKSIIDDWNQKVSKVKHYGDKEKIEFIARFHIYFEMIHPFFDGNGRIGRMLLEEQLCYLFDKIIVFKPDLKDYYDSVQLASKGNEHDLRSLIYKEVKK
ncbi:MAG: Fic family protein [Proteobacteria bacterium]|nr:Fic family protein [Pseudomonadota bacterium]